MLRNITSTAMTAVRGNRILCENERLLTFAKLLQYRFYSEIAPNTTPEPDKLYKRIEVEVRGNDPAVLSSYGVFVSKAASHLDVKMEKNFTPGKSTHERWTLLKSKHIFKKHRVQYEIRTYYRFMSFRKLTGSTADTFLEYIQRNLPEGVSMKVTKQEIRVLPESVRQAPTLESAF